MNYETLDVVSARADFMGQVLISTGDIANRSGFVRHSAHGLVVLAHHRLPVEEVIDGKGVLLGLLIGHPIESGVGPHFQSRIKDLEGHSSSDASYELLEQELYKLGGKYIFVGCLNGDRRLYLDANGCMPIVYSSETRSAASSSGLLLSKEEYTRRFRASLYKRLSVDNDGWFPAGLTAHQGLSRLLCNHYLDLDTWAVVRHWPKKPIVTSTQPLENVSRISDIVRGRIDVLKRKGKVGIALTGGNETRFLLSCLRSTEGLKFYTVAAGGSERDVYLARVLARQFNLDHQVLPFVESSAEAEEAYRYASSHCVGGSNPKTYRSTQPTTDVDYFIGGLGGEVGRAFFWRSSDASGEKLDAADVCGRFGLPKSEEVFAATEKWFQGVKDFDSLTILDLAYIELRMCPWAFAAEHANTYSIQMHPMVCREIYENMLSLPPEWKRTNMMISCGIKNNKPELLDVPINSYGVVRDSLSLIKRLAANPHVIARKFRKTFSGRFR